MRIDHHLYHQPDHQPDHSSSQLSSHLLTLALLALCTLFGGCEPEAIPTSLVPIDRGLAREMGSFVPEALDAAVETDMPRRSLFGEPCEEGWECESGYCIDTPSGRVCTDRCIGDCPPGFECVPTSIGGDDTLLCAADGDDLCERCTSDSDCDDPEDLCLSIGQFTYCGEACASDSDCPMDFQCQVVTRAATEQLTEITQEEEVSQCVPISGECAPCLDEDGDGYGIGEDCLGYDCADDDPTRHIDAPEVCDLIDNDCDSLIDESPTDTPPAELSCATSGVCVGSSVQCLSGLWMCDYPETYEELEQSCDGLDNDCDDSIDELLTPPLSDLQSGVCEAAVKLCQGVDGWVNPEYQQYSEDFEELEMSCDTLDNDCDGAVDEGYDFSQDLANCGGCGVVCSLAQAQMACVEGACSFVECQPNFYDLNRDLSDGCEYGCAVSNEGAEACDLIDNDCDGAVDEGYDTTSDPLHCGACGRACQFNQATALCERAQCALGECDEGFYDLNAQPEDGCEYACVFIDDLDLPDVDRADTDCDGVDGSLNHAVFLSTQGNDALGGDSPSSPVRTLARALEVAAGLRRSQIWVATGAYQMDRSITLSGAVSIYGGYNADFSQRDEGRSQFNFSSRVGLEVRDLTAPMTLMSLNITVSDRVITSEASQALQVLNAGSFLTLEDCEVYAGRGGNGRDGSPGSNGSAGSRGLNASGTSGGLGGATGGGRGASGSYRAAGSAGSSGSSNGSACGGRGGNGSGTSGIGCNDGDPRAGGGGGDGCNGSIGAHGAGGNGVGSWSGASWGESGGRSGGSGTRGGGGGGGGAGGGESCTVFGSCVYCATGRGGGGGGGGGSGGNGGRPGSGGGGSFAIVISQSTVTIKRGFISNGGGGHGGSGGVGGSGGAGGPGGSGVNSSSDSEGDGGDGGNGGRGGQGGCGGGGGGGPSVLFQGLGGAQVRLEGDVQTTVSAGGNGGGSCGVPGARGRAVVSDQVVIN